MIEKSDDIDKSEFSDILIKVEESINQSKASVWWSAHIETSACNHVSIIKQKISDDEVNKFEASIKKRYDCHEILNKLMKRLCVLINLNDTEILLLLMQIVNLINIFMCYNHIKNLTSCFNL